MPIKVCRLGRSLILAGAPKKTTDKLQRVLHAAAQEVSNRGKYDRGLT